MEDEAIARLTERVARLERRARLSHVAAAAGAAAVLAGACTALVVPRRADQSSQILRGRGLIIEDAQGRERVLVGAPVPKVPGRMHQDEAVGLIVLGENGADRVAVAAPTPGPQISGRVSERIGAAAGLVLDDREGNERGGFGVLDNDSRVVFGIDYPGGRGEAITLAVVPNEGAQLALNDTHSMRRVMLIEQNDSAAKFLAINPKDNSTLDLGLVRLNPFAIHRATVKADDKAVADALESMKP